ncbi:putative MFS family arabinose efflux permease [Rhodococcus sp. SMB37]|uniref:MFS transporter n=1 Tax=Rhodococcus sp. SMB37 TaxID=2512213 RepID=UPI0010CE010F|nr:putative MFS family arabinose efflux permease [Rhodococcus sp. SMB37]
MEAHKTGTMLRALAHPVFRRLFTAQVVALVGTGLLTVALGLLAYDLAGSDAGAVLGTALAIKMLAYVAVAPVIAALTDRLPRKTVLITADAVRAVVALALPFVAQVWQIYALIFVLQAASATFTPAFQSVIPSVLEDEDDYTAALSLSRLAHDLEAVLSPMLAAALLLVIDYNVLFIGTVLGFAASGVLVWTTSLPPLPPPDRGQPLRARITAGARVMTARPVLRALLVMNLAVAAATALVLVNTVVYVRDLLGGSNTGVAVALGCYGAGSMAVALTLPRVLSQAPDRTVMLAGCTVLPIGLTAVAVVLFIGPGPVLGWAVLAAMWGMLGAGTSLVSTPSARLLRYQSTPSTRSAVFTAQFSLSHACFLLTYPVAGWVGARVGQPVAAVALALLATLAVVVATRLWPRSMSAKATEPSIT